MFSSQSSAPLSVYFILQMATATPLVLKAKDSLAGKSLIPVINALKVHNDNVTLELARLKKDYPVESYALNELHSEFERLTGKPLFS